MGNHPFGKDARLGCILTIGIGLLFWLAIARGLHYILTYPNRTSL